VIESVQGGDDGVKEEVTGVEKVPPEVEGREGVVQSILQKYWGGR